MNTKMTGAQFLDSGRRFSVTMWEYSWMVQRSGRQSEYEDWERGYECIRIDAFPHYIAKSPEGEVSDEITFLAPPKSFMWRNHEKVTVNPRKGLVEFMKKAISRAVYKAFKLVQRR